MNVLLFGSNGGLGSIIVKEFKQSGLSVDSVERADYDIVENNEFKINRIFKKKYDYIINCAAFIGINECEKKRREAYLVNSRFLKILSKYSRLCNSKLIHFSTDNVFECLVANEDHSENGEACPTSWYGLTKLMGEYELIENRDALIIRLPMLMSADRGNRKFTVNKLLSDLVENKEVVAFNDIYNTPILVEEMAPIIYNIIMSNKISSNLIHITGDKTLSIYDLLLQLCDARGIDSKKIQSKSIDDFVIGHRKPKAGGLDSVKFQKLRFDDMLNRFSKRS